MARGVGARCLNGGSDHALRQHGIGDFLEAGDVRAIDVVDVAKLAAFPLNSVRAGQKT